MTRINWSAYLSFVVKCINARWGWKIRMQCKIRKKAYSSVITNGWCRTQHFRLRKAEVSNADCHRGAKFLHLNHQSCSVSLADRVWYELFTPCLSILGCKWCCFPFHKLKSWNFNLTSSHKCRFLAIWALEISPGIPRYNGEPNQYHPSGWYSKSGWYFWSNYPWQLMSQNWNILNVLQWVIENGFRVIQVSNSVKNAVFFGMISPAMMDQKLKCVLNSS